MTVGVVVASVVGVFVFRGVVKGTQVAGQDVGSSLAAVVNAVAIQILNRGVRSPPCLVQSERAEPTPLVAVQYRAIANWLNNFENHPTDTAYEDGLIGARARTREGGARAWPGPYPDRRASAAQPRSSSSNSSTRMHRESRVPGPAAGLPLSPRPHPCSMFYIAFFKNAIEDQDEDPLEALALQLGIIFGTQLLCVRLRGALARCAGIRTHRALPAASTTFLRSSCL